MLCFRITGRGVRSAGVRLANIKPARGDRRRGRGPQFVREMPGPDLAAYAVYVSRRHITLCEGKPQKRSSAQKAGSRREAGGPFLENRGPRPTHALMPLERVNEIRRGKIAQIGTPCVLIARDRADGKKKHPEIEASC